MSFNSMNEHCVNMIEQNHSRKTKGANFEKLFLSACLFKIALIFP